MAVLFDSNQYKYTGKGPLDAKALVKTYAELLLEKTWTVNGQVAAYNGMITAVWLNKDDASKNGIYFLHDATVTSALKIPDVTKEANWHKLGGLNALPGLADQVSAIQEELSQLKDDIEDLQEAATVVKESRASFPTEGIPGKLYIATEEAMTYVWHDNDYLPVGDGGDNDEIQIIHGGSALA